MKHNAPWHSATLRAQRDLSPGVREFEIRPERGVRPWSVGSHLDLRVLIDGREEKRSYSLVGLPDAPGADEVYRIAVRRADDSRGGSRFMWGLQTGDELRIGEPNNHFEIGWQAPHTLLVAGGIGITPILGMAQLLARRGASLRMLYAARHAADLIYRDVLYATLGDRLQWLCSDAGQRTDDDAYLFGKRVAPAGRGITELQFDRDLAAVHADAAHGLRAHQVGVDIRIVDARQGGADGIGGEAHARGAGESPSLYRSDRPGGPEPAGTGGLLR